MEQANQQDGEDSQQSIDEARLLPVAGRTADQLANGEQPSKRISDSGGQGLGAGDVDVELLLPKRLVTTPTGSRKLAGMRDLGYCAVLLLPYLLMKLFRLVMGTCGVSEHRWKGVPNDLPLTKSGRERINAVITQLRAGILDTDNLLQGTTGQTSSQKEVSMAAAPIGLAAAAILRHLHEVITALEAVARQQGLQLTDTQRAQVSASYAARLSAICRDCVNPQDVLKALRHEGKTCLLQLVRGSPMAGLRAAEISKAYIFQCLMHQSMNVPLHHHKQLLILDDASQVIETCSLLPLDSGLEYLKAFGEQFSDHVSFMTEFPRMRPSDVKKEWVAQAMTINARMHGLTLRAKDGQIKEIVAYPRSGAFAVHGRKPKGVGLAGLLSARASLRGGSLDDKGTRTLLKRLKYGSIEALEPEIHIRSVVCVAQALPVIMAALRQAALRPACLEAALRAGAFLHVQQSLLSDLNANECSYLQDTKGALDILSERVSIRFTRKPPLPLAVDKTTNRILLSLDAETLPPADALPGGQAALEQLLSRTFRLQAVVFSQGVNVLQSLGFFMVGDKREITQDIINRESLEKVNEYAAAAGRASGPALAALNRHYTRGSTRGAKDTEAIWLVRQATAEVGGTRAVNCKSGKDRTALELALSFSQEACLQGYVPSRLQYSLKERLQVGLSYELTGENNGQPNAYAFSELELACLPAGWAPPWRYCGKVMS